MLTKARSGASKNTSSYYKERSYYEENAQRGASYYREDGNAPMLWFGAGAAHYGLSGAFQPDDFAKFDKMLTDGEIDGKRVPGQTTGQERRYGEDFTFSVPKSFSAAAIVYGDDRLKDAFLAAVMEVGIPELERHFGARQKIDGETRHVAAGAFGAVAIHETARPAIDEDGRLHVDPHLHAHVVFANMAEREDGEIRAAHWQRFEKDTLKTISAKVDADFYNRAVALGYELEKRGDFYEIKAIDERTCEYLSTRSKDNIEKELAKMGLTRETASDELKQSLAYSTRREKVDLSKDEVAKLQKDNLEAIGVHQKQKEYVESVKDFKSQDHIEMSDERRAQIIDEIKSGLRHLSERQVLFTEDALTKYVIEHSEVFATAREIKELQREAGALESTKTDDKDRIYLTTKEALARDEKIVELLEKGKGVLAQDERKATDQEVTNATINLQIKNNFSLTEDQRNAISVATQSDDRYVVIQGIAGTGKSVSAEAIKDLYEDKGIKVVGLAQTNKASSGLEDIGIESETIEKWANEGAKFECSSVIIIDEAGLVSSKDMLKVMNAAEKADAKVILIGDQLQMRSIEAGSPFVLLQEHGADKTVLTTVMRQENRDIKSIVDDFGKGKTQVALDKLEAFAHETEKVNDYNKKISAIAEKAASIYLEKDSTQTVIITDTHKMREAVNSAVREGLKEKGAIAQEETTIQAIRKIDATREEVKKVSTYTTALKEHENIVVTFHRSYERGFSSLESGDKISVEKGESFKVVSTEKKDVILESEKGERVAWNPNIATKATLYEQHDMKVSVGDHVTIKENIVLQDITIRNGASATILSVDDDKITAQLKNGEKVEITKDEKLALEYDYAKTVHATQGIKSENVIVAVNSSSLTVDANLVNVAASRAVNNLDVVTDSIDRLKENAAEFKFNDNAINSAKDQDRSKYDYEHESEKLHVEADKNSIPKEYPESTQGHSDHDFERESVPAVYPESTQTTQEREQSTMSDTREYPQSTQNDMQTGMQEEQDKSTFHFDKLFTELEKTEKEHNHTQEIAIPK